ncbi:cell division septation protein DedD [Parvibaculum indicum]|uniref:SPOR domain-containing protein n=1 Tax=Parvibaculum indicum TaxID=562969 RepID=UPI001422C7EA|nr:SPOR domain-containing protein [Parvibaculum indicum]NIJ42120.1 cell division septation protein DedD [Parvibaculum indicum]
MAKKPASLTGDLLARKGEARPSDLKPVNDEGPQGADISVLPGRQPHLEGIGVKGQVSTTLSPEEPVESGGSEEMASEDDGARPSPPEPEIIYTPEDHETGSRTKLVAGAFIGVALLGGVLLALMFNGGDRGTAPVLPQETDGASGAGQAASETASRADEPAVAVETVPAGTDAAPETQAAAPAESLADIEVATLRSTTAEETAETAGPDAAATSDPALEPAPAAATPAATEPAARTENSAPAPDPATPKTAEAEAEATVAPAAPVAATGGNWVVQLLASRSEADAKAAWQTLSTRHGSILGGHGLDIQKADLGDKGTFFRVRAAGFETKAAAAKACGALKGAGQDCLVRQR